MTYTSHELLIIALTMTVGSIIQGAVGFASGLLGVPLLVICGIPLVDATVINFVSTSVLNTAGAVQLWPHLEPRELVWPNLLRFVGLPFGIVALSGTQSLDPGVVQQIIGGVLLGSVVLLTALRIEPRDHLPLAWTSVAFLISGFLMGFATVGGAPMVLYVNSLTWSAAKSRGFLFFCSAAMIPLMAVMVAWRFGPQAVSPAYAALLTMPLVIGGVMLGLKIGHRLDKHLFRKVSYWILTLIALAAIIGPMFQ